MGWSIFAEKYRERTVSAKTLVKVETTAFPIAENRKIAKKNVPAHLKSYWIFATKDYLKRSGTNMQSAIAISSPMQFYEFTRIIWLIFKDDF